MGYFKVFIKHYQRERERENGKMLVVFLFFHNKEPLNDIKKFLSSLPLPILCPNTLLSFIKKIRISFYFFSSSCYSSVVASLVSN